MAHQPLAAVIGEFVGMAAQQGGHLGLNRLRQQRSCAVTQDLGQRIGECSWLGELENISPTFPTGPLILEFCRQKLNLFKGR
jgi:hypothetical protein